MSITEALVERAVLDLLQELGWRYENPADIAPDGPDKRRTSNGEVILPGLLEEAARRINPHIPQEALLPTLKQVQVTVLTGLIFMVCVLLFRRGIVGEFNASRLAARLGLGK